MDYEQSRAAFEAACKKNLDQFHRVDPRNDIWQCAAPVQLWEVTAIMREADLVFQPGFGEEVDDDGMWYIMPKTFGADNTWHWGMAIGIDGSVCMNMF